MILKRIFITSIVFLSFILAKNALAYGLNDSLKTETIEQSIDSLNTTARKEWKAEHYETSIAMLLDVLDKNQNANNNIGIIKTCNKLGFIYLHLSNYSRSYSYFNNALEVNKAKKLKLNTLYDQLNLSYISLQLDDPERALLYLNEVLSTVFTTGDSSLIKRTYGIT